MFSILILPGFVTKRNVFLFVEEMEETKFLLLKKKKVADSVVLLLNFNAQKSSEF